MLVALWKSDSGNDKAETLEIELFTETARANLGLGLISPSRFLHLGYTSSPSSTSTTSLRGCDND